MIIDPIAREKARLEAMARMQESGQSGWIVPFYQTPPLKKPWSEFDPLRLPVMPALSFFLRACACPEHGEFIASLLPGEKTTCPVCLDVWLGDVRQVITEILDHARRWSDLARFVDPYKPATRALELMNDRRQAPLPVVSWNPPSRDRAALVCW